MIATLRRVLSWHAIFDAHCSEDLYKNDIHYIDEVLHQDEYILSVDHENELTMLTQIMSPMDERKIYSLDLGLIFILKIN